METPRHQAGREKNLFLSDEFAVRPQRHVNFHLGPQLAKHSILKRSIVRHRRAAFLAVSGRNGPAKSALKIEVSIALTEGDGRRDQSITAGEAAIGNAAGKKHCDDVIAILLIASQ